MNSRLPIYDVEDQILGPLETGNRLIIEAPTGSGKSTQVPQILLDHGLFLGKICVLQPRRIAARMLARRVAQERDCLIGGEVGYQVRFDRHVGPETRLVYETDGVLLRQMLNSPTLDDIDVIVFDEFHERHLYGDIMLGLGMRLQKTRPNLKLVVMSATLDAAKLEAFMAPCPVVRSEGRTFPVDITYLDKAPQNPDHPWDIAGSICEKAVKETAEGHTLIFMPGAYAIQKTVDQLSKRLSAVEFDILPLHGSLRPEEQDRAVALGNKRKIIVATNVAETSLTIDGVTCVIDSGLFRKACFDPHRGINTLLIEKTSKASADQRAGRAGRTRPGRCYRLWTEHEHSRRADQEDPEILRLDLSETMLHLKAQDVPDLDTFPWVDHPDTISLERSMTLLDDLGALHNGEVTELGKRMAAFPLHPRHARMFITGEYYGCLPSAALAAALLQEKSIIVNTKDSRVIEHREALFEGCEHSDVLCLMRAYNYAVSVHFNVSECREMGIHATRTRQVHRLLEQFLDIAENQGMDADVFNPCEEALCKSILAGFADQVARRDNAGQLRCSLVHQRRGSLDKKSVARQAALIVAAEINEIGSRGNDLEVRLSLVTEIQESWLDEMFADDVKVERCVEFDPDLKRVRAWNRRWFHDLCTSETRGDDPTHEEAASVLAEEVLDGHIKLKKWDDSIDRWLARVSLVGAHCPEFGVSPMDAEARKGLIEQICYGCLGAKEVKQVEIKPILNDWLSYESRSAVKEYAPEQVTLSNGKKPKVHYPEDGTPYIALRVQELYDVNDVPPIANGKVKLNVHILAPNQRVVQITDDLKGFWSNSYEQVKKDLKGRYPKHEWR